MLEFGASYLPPEAITDDVSFSDFEEIIQSSSICEFRTIKRSRLERTPISYIALADRS
jgi:hypothetical protein